MVSVVIATENSESGLVSTLAALVAGAVAGVVREVIIADAGSRDDTAAIADVAGCRLLTSAEPRGARLKAAAEVARSRWLLFLDPGAIPQPSWIDETRRFIEETERAGRANDIVGVFPAAPSSFRPAPLNALSRLWAVLTFRPPGGALLIAKSHYQARGGHRDIDDTEGELIQRLGRQRIVRLRTGITVR